MEAVSLDLLSFPFALPVAAAAASSYYDDELVSQGSTRSFATAPSSPRRSKMYYYDYYYLYSAASVPSTPHMSTEVEEEGFSNSTDLQASVPFSWEVSPGTPKRSSVNTDPEFEFNSFVLDNRRAVSAPTSPTKREHTFMFELRNVGHQEATKKAEEEAQVVVEEEEEDMDSGFEFSSRVSDAESSTQMSSADELFFKGKILPLKLQAMALKSAFHNSDKGSSMCAPQSPKSPRKGGDLRMRSMPLPNGSSTEVKNAKGISKQGWAKALTPSRLFQNEHWQRTVEATQIAPKIPSLIQQTSKSRAGSKKSVELHFNHLHISDVIAGTSLQVQNVKTSSSHVHARDEQTSHPPDWNAYDSTENVAVKKWYDKDGDKRTKKGAARSWPRPSVRSVLATRSARDATSSSSKPATLAASHELHYRNNRVTLEQMRRKTFLPYKQSLLGCLGFGNMKVPGLSSTLEAIGR